LGDLELSEILGVCSMLPHTTYIGYVITPIETVNPNASAITDFLMCIANILSPLN